MICYSFLWYTSNNPSFLCWKWIPKCLRRFLSSMLSKISNDVLNYLHLDSYFLIKFQPFILRPFCIIQYIGLFRLFLILIRLVWWEMFRFWGTFFANSFDFIKWCFHYDVTPILNGNISVLQEHHQLPQIFFLS